MRVTIIANDNIVFVEEQPLPVDVSALDPEISVIQWYGTVGEIEYHTNTVENSRRPNVRFTDFSPFQSFVDDWELEARTAPD